MLRFTLALLLSSFYLPSLADSASTDARAFHAARDGQWAELAALRPTLDDDYPLAPYLSFYGLRARIDLASVDEVLAWLRQHDDLPLHDAMRSHAMHYYGKHGKHDALLAVSQGVPGETVLRCYYFSALLDSDREHAIKGARDLWLTGQSRPSGCDTLFGRLKDEKVIDDELVWQRMLLAFRSNNASLMRYLRSQMRSTSFQARAEKLLRLYQKPMETRVLMPATDPRELALNGLHRLADKDPVYARKLVPILGKRYALTDSERDTVLARVAWFSTIRDLPENRAWLEQYLADTSSLRLLEQRVRRAVIEQDWDNVLHWVDRLPQSEQHSARWRYWRARALGEQGHDDSLMYLQLAANERSFWGFLAAQTLGKPYALNNQPAPADTPAPDEQQQRALRRIETLIAINEHGLARDEWLYMLRRSDSAALQALANQALQRGWYHFSVETALFSGQRNVLDWRFPAAMQSNFEQLGAQLELDPWLLMALSRRESAFNPHARSPVGATGLMQLMPATAKQVARQIGMTLKGTEALHDPDTNLRLGGQYLADLLQRYNGNRVLALAAYNAGPHRVDRWLDERELPFDVFIESIPFYETREYVQAVLAYRVILSRHGEQEALASLMNPAEKSPAYSPVLLAADTRERSQ